MRDIRREQLITNPQVGVYPGDNQGDVEKALAESSFSIAEMLDEKANKKFEMDFQNDAAEGINSAYQRNQNNPQQLNEELESLRSGLVQAVPFNMHDDFNNQFKRASQPYVNKATDGYDRLLTDQVKESSLRNIDLARTDLGAYAADLLSDNPAKVIDATAAGQEKLMEAFNTISQTDASGMPVFSATERFNMSKELVDSTAYGAVREAFDSTPNKHAFLKKFNDGELKAAIFLDENQNFVSASVKDRMDRSTYERTVNYMESQIESIEREAAKRAEAFNNVQLIDGVMNGEAILDPTRKEHKKAVDAYYTQLAPKIAAAPLAEKGSMIVDLVSKTGIWPTELESTMTAQLSNGSPAQKAAAADVINAVAQENPQTMYQMSDSIRARAAAISNNINAGMDPETASKYAENSVFKKDSPEYKLRQKKFSDPKNGEEIPFSPSKYKPGIINEPEIPDAMVSDYNTLNSAYYMDEGLDARTAAKLADEKIGFLWKVTEVDGHKRWMKYAPEAMYNNKVGTEWIGEQLRHELGQIPSVKEEGEEEEIFLTPHPKTVRFPDPTYLVFKKDKNGITQPYLNQKGNQVTFKPDYESSPSFTSLVKEFDGDKKTAMLAAQNRRRQQIRKQEQVDAKKAFKKARSDAFMNSFENFLSGE